MLRKWQMCFNFFVFLVTKSFTLQKCTKSRHVLIAVAYSDFLSLSFLKKKKKLSVINCIY